MWCSPEGAVWSHAACLASSKVLLPQRAPEQKATPLLICSWGLPQGSPVFIYYGHEEKMIFSPCLRSMIFFSLWGGDERAERTTQATGTQGCPLCTEKAQMKISSGSNCIHGGGTCGTWRHGASGDCSATRPQNTQRAAPASQQGSTHLPPPSTFSSLHSEHDAPAHLGEEKLSITLKCEASSLEFNLHR